MISPERRQLNFAFADSPQGGEDDENLDVSRGRSFLLQRARDREANRVGTGADGECRLLERIASPSNMALAMIQVARNKGAAGVDGQSVAEVLRHVRSLLHRLSRAVLDGTYVPGDVRRVWIPKPGGGQRGLGIPNVVDRWVQQALHQVLEPIFEPTFHHSSHGFRPRRGARTAVAEVREHLAEGFVWLVSIDLSKFFDRVHHQRLLGRMSQHVDDGRVLKLVNRILKARVAVPDGERVPTTEGTPQGGPLSPLLSNIVLNELDWELERRKLRFVRYADDFLVFVRSERAALRVMDSTSRYIERRLRLKVNRDKSSVSGPDTTHFLGFRFECEPGGRVEVYLSKRSVSRLSSRIRELTPRNWGRSLQACLVQVSRYFRGWLAHFRLLTEAGARHLRTFDAHARRRIRAIVVKQKRRPRFLFRHLCNRGVSPRAAASTAYSGHRIWAQSYSPGIHRGYPNAWFAEQMTLLWSEWQRLCPGPVSRQLELFTE